MLRQIVFVVLMMFWLFFGCYWTFSKPSPYEIGSTLIPWLCVALLGYEVYKGGQLK